MEYAASAVRRAMGSETGFGAGASRTAVHSIQRRVNGLQPEVVVYITGVVVFIILTLPPVWTLLNYVTPRALNVKNKTGGLSVIGYVCMLLTYCFVVAISLVASRARQSNHRRRHRHELEEAANSRR